MSVELVKRARVEACVVYRRRSWRTVDGRFRLSEFVRLLEGNRRVWYAERCDVVAGRECWEIVSRHRKRAAAVAAIARAAKGRRR
jgi:hypothetical protein